MYLVMDSGAHIVRKAGRKIKHNHAKTHLVMDSGLLPSGALAAHPIKRQFRERI
jgi:hypothetical protein